MPVPPIKLDAAQRAKILEMMADGAALKVICKEIGISIQTLTRIRMADSTFEKECLHAQAIGFEVLADSLATISEDIQDVNKARLKSDNLKWLLARRAASKYGDRLDVTVQHNIDISSVLTDARSRVLPVRDQYQAIDAELVTNADSLPSSATDSLSVLKDERAELAVETGDAGNEPSRDVWD